jgi:uncharacterized protein (TIGR03067 family)
MTRRSLFTVVWLCLSCAAGLATPVPKQDPIKEALRALKGEWHIVSRFDNGAATPLNDRIVAFEGDRYTLRTGGTVTGEATIKVAPTEKPAQMDWSYTTEGPYKGKTQLGIYKIEGDTITFCLAPIGQPRPAEFSSNEGGGHILATYKRVKK